MNLRIVILILFSSTLFTQCVEEDFFGESTQARIKKIVVSNQSGNAIINEAESTITVEIPGGVDLSNIVLTSLEISSFATSSVQVGEHINLTEPVTIVITSEGGDRREWYLTAFVATENPQLDNHDLNAWYETATGYYEPGESASSTIWGTGNRGTQLLNRLATTPIDLGNGDIAAKMETLDNGPLGGLVGTPISAGSLFTGYFNPDNISPTNPQAAIEFGTPFAGRPSKLRFSYSYEPGALNKNKSGNVLDYPDECSVYALLEVHTDGQIKRLATAWFRSSQNQTELTTIEIPFTYGLLANSFPDYMFPENELFVDNESAEFMLPTHITFVASSSFDGDNFAGAVGSTLIIDDVEMVYD